MTYFSTKAIVADIQKADKSGVNAYFLWKLSNTVKRRLVNLTQFVSKIVETHLSHSTSTIRVFLGRISKLKRFARSSMFLSIDATL